MGNYDHEAIMIMSNSDHEQLWQQYWQLWPWANTCITMTNYDHKQLWSWSIYVHEQLWPWANMNMTNYDHEKLLSYVSNYDHEHYYDHEHIWSWANLTIIIRELGNHQHFCCTVLNGYSMMSVYPFDETYIKSSPDQTIDRPWSGFGLSCFSFSVLALQVYDLHMGL